MAKKLIISIIFIVVIITLFTINAFALAVTVPVDLADPTGSLYTPQTTAFFFSYFHDGTYTDIDQHGEFLTTIPIISPLNLGYEIPVYRTPTVSEYRIGTAYANTKFIWETSYDDFTFNTVGTNVLSANISQQVYSGYYDVASPIMGNHPDFGFYIPEMLIWNENISSAYGVNQSNSVRIQLNNYVNYISVSEFTECTFTIGLYGLEHKITCGLNPRAFLKTTELQDGSLYYWVDFNITWDMLNGAEYEGEPIIYIYDDDYEGVSVIEYFDSYYSDPEETEFLFSNSMIFEANNLEVGYTTSNYSQFELFVETCDRHDLRSQYLFINKQTIAAPFSSYTGFVSKAVSGVLTVQILPGFTIGGILLVMVAFCLVMWFLKLFAGG